MYDVNDVLEIELILNRKKYNIIYNALYVFIIIILIFVITIFTYKYHSYCIMNGSMIDNKLELLVNINDLKYLDNNNELFIDNIKYKYKISNIHEDLYKDDNYNNYKYIYLNVDNLKNVDNFIYKVKIKKESKTLAAYLKQTILKEE